MPNPYQLFKTTSVNNNHQTTSPEHIPICRRLPAQGSRSWVHSLSKYKYPTRSVYSPLGYKHSLTLLQVEQTLNVEVAMAIGLHNQSILLPFFSALCLRVFPFRLRSNKVRLETRRSVPERQHIGVDDVRCCHP